MKINLSCSRWYLIAPVFIFLFLGFKEITLPGLYMDSVNPDYQAAWIQRGAETIPAWIYPDNFFAGPYKLPLLNSLYGGNITAYFGLLFFQITGYGLAEVRVFHGLLGVLMLIFLAWCLNQWNLPKVSILAALCILAADPSFLYAWRTQYYLQLVPVIFMAVGLGILGKCYNQPRNFDFQDKRLFGAGILLGLAAYSYFIFAFYAAAIVVSYAFLNKKKHTFFKVAIPLAGGVVIGWLPFVYAHLSIIVETNFHGYLEQLRSLQTTYGVVDEAQGGLWARTLTVWDRLANLRAGSAVETTIFGNSKNGVVENFLSSTILVAGPILFLFYVTADKFRMSTAGKHESASPRFALATILIAILCSHIVVGLIVGRPLGFQHYVMLLPILYSMIAVSLPINWRAASTLNISKKLSIAVLTLCASALVFNVALSQRFFERLKNEGGQGMYSDAINLVSAHLETMSPDTTLLFPQWGYWMGAVTIIGPRYSVFEAPNLGEMENKLAKDSALQNRKSFALVLGKEFLTGDEQADKRGIEDFAAKNRLHIEDIVRCYGRSGPETIWLIKLKRLPNQE